MGEGSRGVVALFAGGIFILLGAVTLAVAVVEGGCAREGRRLYGWKIIQENPVDWVDAFLWVTGECLQVEGGREDCRRADSWWVAFRPGVTCEKMLFRPDSQLTLLPSTFSRYPPIHLPRSATYRTPNGFLNFLPPRSHHQTRLATVVRTVS